VRESVGIYGVGSQLFKHFTDNTFSRGNIAGQTNDVFSGPIAHGFSINILICTLVFILLPIL
jgi:hypothetical protein